MVLSQDAGHLLLDRAVVLVLHDIDVTSVHSDRIVAMRAGRIVGDGTPEQILGPNHARGHSHDIDVHEIGHRIGVHYA